MWPDDLGVRSGLSLGYYKRQESGTDVCGPRTGLRGKVCTAWLPEAQEFLCPSSSLLCHTQLSSIPLIPSGTDQNGPHLGWRKPQSLFQKLTLEGALLQRQTRCSGRKNSSFCLNGTPRGGPIVPVQGWQPLTSPLEGAVRGRQ